MIVVTGKVISPSSHWDDEQGQGQGGKKQKQKEGKREEMREVREAMAKEFEQR